MANNEQIDKLRETLKNNLSFIESLINKDKSPNPEDIDGIVGHGIEMAAVIGLCAKSLADAKELLLKCELNFMQENKDLWDKPTIIKKLMDGTLAEENALIVLADRLMSAYTHKMDFYRSIVSKYKEELRLNNQFKQN